MNRWKTFLETWILVFAVVTLSLPIVHVDNYGVTLSFFVLIGFLVRLRKFSSSWLIIFLIIAVFFILNALASITVLDEYEFIKSFGLTTVFILSYCAIFGSGNDIFKFINIRLFLWASTLLVVGYEATQVFESLVFGSTSSWFFLDDYSISTATDVGRFEAVNFAGYFRPVSLYHEPSYLGIVLLMLFVINGNTLNSRLLGLTLLIAIAITLSMVAIIFTLAYVGCLIFPKNKLIIYTVPFALFFTTGVFGVDSIIEVFRLGEMMTEGTSGWVRVMLPFEQATSILKTRYLGNALGQNEIIFDNSLFLFLVYFGAALPILLIIWIYALIKRIGKNMGLVRYLIFFVGLISLNGAIFTPESTLILLLVTLTFFDSRLILTKPKLRDES